MDDKYKMDLKNNFLNDLNVNQNTVEKRKKYWTNSFINCREHNENFLLICIIKKKFISSNRAD